MIKKNEKIVLRKIHDSYFLIDISDKYNGDRCSLFEINETGVFIWNSISSEKEISDVAKELQNAIVDDIDFDIILSDASEYITELSEKGFLEVV